MKNIKITSIILGILLISISCSDEFLDVAPPGSYSAPSLQNPTGVEGMLIATYSALDGSWFESWGNNHFNQNGGASNWGWGGIRSDDSYKGTELTDGADWNPIERAEVQPGNNNLNNKWNACYDGIGKANATLQNLEIAKDDFSTEDYARIQGEARFLRGHFHFEALKVFGRVPFVGDTVINYAAVQNSDNLIWADLEADFRFAYDNLPGTMSAAGRANKYAAGAMLAKVMVYQAKWSDAKTIFDDVINNGTTSDGTPLDLTSQFHDVFRADKESGNPELIFGYEAAFGDGSISNGNYEQTLNQPHGSNARTSCCGFFQPSQNLVNSYEVDGSGLPMPATFNEVDILSDEGAPPRADWDAEAEYLTGDGVNVQIGNQDFGYTSLTDGNKGNDPETSPASWELTWTEDITTPLDPRLDWTVGRRSVPYMDWGINPGSTGGWVRNVPNGGIYNPMKSSPSFAEFDAELAGVIDWGFTSSAKNVHIIRFADVLLLAAEVEAELNNLAQATDYVNRVRARAANEEGFVKNPDGSNAANYSISEYPTFGSQADALTAIRFERKLELAMEGHRMFDLVRWHLNSSSSALSFDIVVYMNDYFAKESVRRAHLANATFEEKHIWMPIPTSVITQGTVDGVQNITQNPGY